MKPLENQDHIVKFDLKLSSHLSFLKHIGACIPTGLAGCNSFPALMQLASAPSKCGILLQGRPV